MRVQRGAVGAWLALLAAIGLVQIARGPAWAGSRVPEATPVESVALEVEAPAPGSLVEGGVPWMEVSGWAVAGRSVRHDIAVVVDVSGSTAIASGSDVDGDGKLGKRRLREPWRNFNPRYLSNDPGDTILAAELLATHRLIAALDPGRSRVALLGFAGRTRLYAPLGSAGGEIESALERLDQQFSSGMTNLADATELATEVLLAGARGEDEAPQRSILILSDGYPTSPGDAHQAAEAALEAARTAAGAGVRIYTFALGIDSANEGDVFSEMAKISGGEYVRIPNPGEVVHVLPRIDLARVAELEITNRTSGRHARALRSFSDGSFDAYVPLVEGENQLVVTARGRSGGVRSVERTVVFRSRHPHTPAEEAAVEHEWEALRKRLRARTLETRLAVQMRARQDSRDRSLQVQVDPDE